MRSIGFISIRGKIFRLVHNVQCTIKVFIYEFNKKKKKNERIYNDFDKSFDKHSNLYCVF